MFRSTLTLINHIYIGSLPRSKGPVNQSIKQSTKLTQPNSPPNQSNLCYNIVPQFMLQYSIIFAVSHPFFKFCQIFFTISSYYSDSIIFSTVIRPFLLQ
jgi:hypothetical protein